VQSDISREIAEKLRLRLTAGDQRQLAKRETVNPQAYELVLKGRFYRYKAGTEDRKRASEYYKQAISIDPNYAVAYAGLAATYVDLIGNSSVDPKEFAPKAEAAARKALELDDNLPEAHSIFATLKRYAWQWREAEGEYRRALELNPNFDRAHTAFSYHLSIMGQHEQAIAEAKRGIEVNPLSPLAYRSLAFAFFFARRHDEAIEVLKKVLELEGSHPVTHNWLGFAYTQQEKFREAIAEYREAIKAGISPDNPSVQIYMGAAYARAGDRAQAQTILNRLETSKQYVSPGELPVLYAALGEKERAFASFEKAYATHDMQLQYLGVDPALDPLRSDPRFTDLMRRVGLVPHLN
jgi:tetratricopeptide (TPR) repeat protein